MPGEVVVPGLTQYGALGAILGALLGVGLWTFKRLMDTILGDLRKFMEEQLVSEKEMVAVLRELKSEVHDVGEHLNGSRVVLRQGLREEADRIIHEVHRRVRRNDDDERTPVEPQSGR